MYILKTEEKLKALGFMSSYVFLKRPAGLTVIKPDPPIKGQLGKRLLSTILPPQLQNVLTCGKVLKTFPHVKTFCNWGDLSLI